MASSIILLSSGLDSVATFYWALKNCPPVLALTFDYGQKAKTREIEKSKKLCKAHRVKHKVVSIPWLSEIGGNALTDKNKALPGLLSTQLDNKKLTDKSAKAVWVPNRNGVFVAIAASFAESLGVPFILMGLNKEEGATFPDNSLEFVKRANLGLKFSTLSHPELRAPMIDKDKTEIVRWMVERKISFSNIWSCYLAGKKMCGKCESCLRCQRALKQGRAEEWKKLFI